MKSHRVAELEKIGEKLKKEFIKQNKTGRVLIEEVVDGYYVGYTENYIRTYIPCKKNTDLINKIVQVKIQNPFKDGAKAKIIKEKA